MGLTETASDDHDPSSLPSACIVTRPLEKSSSTFNASPSSAVWIDPETTVVATSVGSVSEPASLDFLRTNEQPFLRMLNFFFGASIL